MLKDVSVSNWGKDTDGVGQGRKNRGRIQIQKKVVERGMMINCSLCLQGTGKKFNRRELDIRKSIRYSMKLEQINLEVL